jgi:hypothetical protein
MDSDTQGAISLVEKEKEVREVAKVLAASPRRLFSTRLCMGSACEDPNNFFVATALGLDLDSWRRTSRHVLFQLKVTKVGAKNDLKGGTWFFVGDQLPKCLVNGRGERCTLAADVDVRRSVNNNDVLHLAKRPKVGDHLSSVGFAFETLASAPAPAPIPLGNPVAPVPETLPVPVPAPLSETLPVPVTAPVPAPAPVPATPSSAPSLASDGRSKRRRRITLDELEQLDAFRARMKPDNENAAEVAVYRATIPEAVLAVLKRSDKMRKPTAELDSVRGRKRDEKRLRLDATASIIGVLNRTDMHDPMASAGLLSALANHLCVVDELRAFINVFGGELTPEKLTRYRYLLKVKQDRLLPLIQQFRKEDRDVCTFDELKMYFNGLEAPEIQSLFAVTQVRHHIIIIIIIIIVIIIIIIINNVRSISTATWHVSATTSPVWSPFWSLRNYTRKACLILDEAKTGTLAVPRKSSSRSVRTSSTFRRTLASS